MHEVAIGRAIRRRHVDIAGGRKAEQDVPQGTTAPGQAGIVRGDRARLKQIVDEQLEPLLRAGTPPVRRIDGAYGDRNLVCSCPPVEAFA